MSVVSMQRWKKLTCTTSSGRVMFSCLSCGRMTDGPTDKCQESTQAKHVVPCHLWPMTADAYQSLGKSSGFIFHGTVIAPDGKMSNISVELEPALVKEFFIVTAEQEFKLDPDDAQMVGSMTAVERRRHSKEGLTAGEEIDRAATERKLKENQQRMQGMMKQQAAVRGMPLTKGMGSTSVFGGKLGGYGGADGSRPSIGQQLADGAADGATRKRRETHYGPSRSKAKGS